jgi:phosphoglycerol transferase MdoB-like AlkP superfamily enzyme
MTQHPLSGTARAAILAAIALVAGAGYLEITSGDPPRFGPFTFAWMVQNHPISSWTALVGIFLLLTLSGRLLFSVLTVSLIYASIVAASWTKIDYLGTPLTLADVRFFTSNLAENSVLFKAYPSLGIMLVGALLLIFIGPLLALRSKRQCSMHARLIAALSLAGLLGGAWITNAEALNPALPQMALFGEEKSMGNGFSQLHRFNATHDRQIPDLLEIFFADASTKFQLPEHIQQSRFKPSEARPTPGAMPDIFVVLEESTFDPRMLQACKEQAVCDNLLFAAPHANQEAGPLFVHTTAGGTWLSEFTFLTGFDWRIFGPGGGHAPLNLAAHMQNALPHHLQGLGYQTIAIYPVGGNFLNARDAYKHYGFEHFLAVEDLHLGTDWMHIRDGQLFDRALQVVAEKRDGRPVFVFLLTIRNHGPHANSHAALPQPEPPALAALPAPLADYLQRLQDSASAMTKLEEEWLTSDRPRVLAWFGDHQPLLASTTSIAHDYTQKHFTRAPTENQMRHATWYAMSTNRKPADAQAPMEQVTDISYLGSQLLAFSGVPPRPADAAIREIQKICPHGIAHCNNATAVREYLSFRVWELKEIE